jgi:hypothetical protein
MCDRRDAAAEAADGCVVSHRASDVVPNEPPTTIYEVFSQRRRQVSRRSLLVGSWDAGVIGRLMLPRAR